MSRPKPRQLCRKKGICLDQNLGNFAERKVYDRKKAQINVELN